MTIDMKRFAEDPHQYFEDLLLEHLGDPNDTERWEQIRPDHFLNIITELCTLSLALHGENIVLAEALDRWIGVVTDVADGIESPASVREKLQYKQVH